MNRFLSYFTSYYLVLLLAFSISSALINPLQAQTKDKFVIVLDAGHGGHDSGNTGNGYYEKNIALNVVKSVGRSLSKDPSVKVIYTRTTDKFITLKKRASIANKADADLFVSVHCNAAGSKTAHGTETFVLGLHANKRNFDVAKRENEVIFLENDYKANYNDFDPNKPESLIGLRLEQEDYLDQSIMLAGLLESNFKNNIKRKSRGVKQAGFWVLHNTYMPSVLIEIGFLTYKPEGRFLNTTTGQSKMALQITKAIKSYKKSLDVTSSSIDYIEDENEVESKMDKPVVTPVNNVVFKVQISAGRKALAPKSYNFKGLKKVSRVKVGKFYKYYYGYTYDYNKIKKLKAEAITKYKNCFIVAFKGGKRIKLADALKTH